MTTTLTITGNLAADPELRYTPTGTAVAKFVVISNDRHRDPAGQWVDGRRTDVRVTAWDTLAENVTESLSTGTRVTVTGRRIEAHAFTSQHDGTLHASLELTADDVQVSLRRYAPGSEVLHRHAATTGADAPEDDETGAAPGPAPQRDAP
ncbi:MAG: single-strand DNA-binding protein [Actinomycetota bacterium]|jgi:single-strand DNA-binding protein|nr:single-strand DNA-binding protein [Actinomycetota bacterium]